MREWLRNGPNIISPVGIGPGERRIPITVERSPPRENGQAPTPKPRGIPESSQQNGPRTSSPHNPPAPRPTASPQHAPIQNGGHSEGMNGSSQSQPAVAQNGHDTPAYTPDPQTDAMMAAIGEKLISMLDEIERRVENLRETASLMEQEKDSLMEMLNTVNVNRQMLRLSESEKDDIEATTNRLIVRCKTVDVSVKTPRNPDQERALQAVTRQIDDLAARMEKDYDSCQMTCHRYLNACAVDQPDGPIDIKFQSHVIGCTAEDQKRIRRRLMQLASVQRPQ